MEGRMGRDEKRGERDDQMRPKRGEKREGRGWTRHQDVRG